MGVLAMFETAITAGGLFELADTVISTEGSGKCAKKQGPDWHMKYPGPAVVRRPTMGLSMKAERHAFFQIYKPDGTIVPLYNGVGSMVMAAYNQSEFPGEESFWKSKHYTDFMITSVQEQRAEKVQIVETFGEGYFFSSGGRVNIIAVTGYLANSADFPWRTEFWENYDRYLRGSKLVESKSRAYFGWDDILVEGYILDAGAAESAENPDLIHFTFKMLVADYLSINAKNFGALGAYLGGKKFDWRYQNLEIQQRNTLEITTSHGEIPATSRGMRRRQRLAKLGLLGQMLDSGAIELVLDMIYTMAISDSEKKPLLELLGSQVLGEIKEKGEDLIWENLGAWLFPPSDENACTPQELSGSEEAKEWWEDVSGWLSYIMHKAEKIGVPIPHDAYVLIQSPLNFLHLIANISTGDIGGKFLSALGIMGFAMFMIPGSGGALGMDIGANSVAALTEETVPVASLDSIDSVYPA